MHFKWLHIDNYKQYWHDFFIDFSEWFNPNNEKNIMLIWAENGTWKTSFIKAIKYVLYWFKTSNWRPLPKTEIAELINNTSNLWEKDDDNGFSFQLDYVSDAWEDMSIRRSRKILWWEKLELIANWKVLDMNYEDISDYINNLIPEWISKFFFFTWEDVKIFTEEEEKKWLKDPIEVVLWINKYSNLIDHLEKIKRRYESREKYTDDYLKKLEDELYELESKSETSSSAKEEAQKEVDELQKQVNEIQEKMDKLFNWEALDKKDIVNEKLLKNKNEQERIRNKISLWKWELPILLLKWFCNDITKEIKYSKEVNQASAFQKEIDATIKALYQPEEIISHTKWDDKYYDIIKNKLLELHWEKAVNKKEFVLDINSHQESEINRVITTLKYKDSISWDELHDLLAKYENLSKEQELLEKEKEELSKNTTRKAEWDELNRELWDLQKKLWIKQAAMSRLAWIDSFRLKESIKDKKREIEDYKSKQAFQNEKSLKAERIGKYIKVLESYIGTLRDREIEETENIIQEKYKDVCHEDIKYVRIDKDSYEISIIDSNNNVKVTHELWDAEKTLFALSIIWWLWKISELEIPLIMDAPIAPLDAEHKKNFLIKYLPKTWRQVILFSNSEHISPDEDHDNIYPYVYNEKTFRKESWFLKKTTVIKSDWYFK